MIISTKNLSEELQKLRTETGLSQTDLAKLAKVNMHTISRIERGIASPTVQTLEKIIRAITNSKEYSDIDDVVLLSFHTKIWKK